MEQEQAYWLAWSQIKGVGAATLKKIYQHFGSLEAAWQAPAIAFAEIDGLGDKFVIAINQGRPKFDAQDLITKHTKLNPQFWVPAEVAYPRLLLETPSPPPLLYYRGEVDPLENEGTKPMIGIVGTRNPTEYGKRWTKKITQGLVQHGFGIVSGMAAGIDAIAHQSCLEANGRTIAVLGTGVDIIYPYSNTLLYQELTTKGLILSEYPAKTAPDRNHFPARNRIIAGLCRAVLIMEAPERSGALITARFANDFCRDVYVLPGSLDNKQSWGCLRLLNSGAHVILGVEQLLEMLVTMPSLAHLPTKSISQTTSQSKPKLEPKLAPRLEQIYQLITHDSISLDAIVEQAELNTGEVLAALSELEIMGLISQCPGMRYQIKE